MIRTLSVAFALAITPAAMAAWPSNPNTNVPIAPKPNEQGVVKITSASDGGCWLSWFDNSAGSYQVFVQKLDFTGTTVFNFNGLQVSANPQNTSLIDWDLHTDGAGGCVLAFTDTRDGGDLDVFAYRIDASGQQAWGANGVQISANTNFDADPRIIRLSTGDFVVAYPRTTGGSATPGIVMQRLDPAGAKLLGTDGVVIAGDGVEGPAFLEMIPSDNGSFIMIWIRDTRTFQSPRHVRCQKFDANGTPLWNGGVPIALSAALSVPIAHKPRIVSDGAGGAVFAWHTSGLQAFAQRVTSAGTSLWNGGAAQQIAVNGTNLSMDPAIVYFPDSGATSAYFRVTNSGQTMSGFSFQTLDAAGARALGDPGVSLVPLATGAVAAPRAARITPIDSVAIYSTTPLGSQDTTVWATRVNQAGIPLWPATRVSPTTGSRFRLGLAMAANGVARACWEGDTRLGTTPDIFAQNINPTGALGFCAGDGNFDLAVNFADLNNVLSQFGQSGLFLAGDVNGDGIVNFADLNLVLSNFGAVCVGP